MHVVVTGAAGFIGSHLSERLLEDGHRVVGIDNFDDFYDPAQKRRNVRALIENPNFELCQSDIRDRGAVAPLLEEADCIVHLAARAGVRPSFALTPLYSDVNVTGTALLLELAQNAGVNHFVFGSSSSVYGEGASMPFTESGALGTPVSPYAVTKLAGEMLCRNHVSHIPRITVLRFFTVYGPRQRPDLAIHKFAARISKGEPIPVFGDPQDTFRDYTYVDDIVDGIRASLGVQEPWSVLNLASGSPISLEQMIDHLEEALGRKAAREMLPPQEGDVAGTWADISLAGETLGYRPSRSFEDGCRHFAEWFNHSAAHPV